MNKSSRNINKRRRQRGGTLLEVLVSLVIFSIGVLGIVGLQATAARNSGEAKYRADAALLTDQLIAQIWTTNVAASGVLGSFSTANPSTISARVSAWRADIAATLPAGTGNVTVIDAATGLISVAVCWQAPAAPQHCHTTTAQIRLNS